MKKNDSPHGRRPPVFVSQPADPATSFLGWRMVAAGTGVLIMSSGIGFYGHGAFLDPLRESFQCSKSSISFALTLFFLTSGLGEMIIGRTVDRYGPRLLMVAGSIIFGAGLMLLSRLNSLWQLYILYPIMALGWSCTSVGPINTLISNWFARRRGLALSITMTGLSVGGIIVVPLVSWTIIKWDLGKTLFTLGVSYILAVTPLALFVIKARPSDVDQLPDGGDPPLNPARQVKAPFKNIPVNRLWTRLEAARTRAFWAITIAFFLALTGQVAFLVHQVSFLSKYLGVQGASNVVGLTALASIAARLALGAVIDRWDKNLVTIACFSAQGLAVLAMAFFHNKPVLYAGPFVFGLTMGNILMLQSLLVGECFGTLSFGAIFGLARMFTMIGAALGPLLAGYLFDLTGSYRIFFILVAVFSAAASLVILAAKPPSTESG